MPPERSPKNILVVNDDALHAKVTKMRLESLGHCVSHFLNYEELFRTLLSNPNLFKLFHVLLADHNIHGGMSGSTALPEIKHQAPELKIIAYSNDDEFGQPLLLEAGADLSVSPLKGINAIINAIAELFPNENS